MAAGESFLVAKPHLHNTHLLRSQRLNRVADLIQQSDTADRWKPAQRTDHPFNDAPGNLSQPISLTKRPDRDDIIER